jgi:SAM-dependent methyltransferase
VRLELGPSPQRVEIVLTGRKNDCSLGRQCLFAGFKTQTGRMVPLRHRKAAKVRGAPFTAAFQRLMAGVPENGLLLDLGGGNRQIDDARYINLDYADYAEPDLIGDATRLPLRDGSVDAVYSTGVFEHIDDPLRAGAEVARVLKRGGKAVIGWAFMQPIHSEGQHFYNATPWGVERAFAGLQRNRMWYETSLAFLIRWGASVSGLVGRAPQEEIEAVCATLSRWDALIPETHKSYMANGVWAEFEKS